MMNFEKYMQFRQADYLISSLAQRYVENQVGNAAQALDQAKQQLMAAFEQEYSKDPSGALVWLNNLYGKVLPQDYKNKYAEFQKAQGTNQQQPQQQVQQQPQQQPQQQVQQQPQNPG